MSKQDLKKIYDALSTDSEKEQLLLSEKISLLEKTINLLIEGGKQTKESEQQYQDAVVSGFEELGKTFDKLRQTTSGVNEKVVKSLETLAEKFDTLGKSINTESEGRQKDFALTIQQIVKGLAGVSETIKKEKPVWNWPQYLYSGLRDTQFSPINPRKEDGHGSSALNPSYVTGTVTINNQYLSGSSPFGTTVTTTSKTMIGSNSLRRGLVITNASGTTVYFGVNNAATMFSGITLYPAGVWVMDQFTFTNQSIQAISGSQGTITCQEFI